MGDKGQVISLSKDYTVSFANLTTYTTVPEAAYDTLVDIHSLCLLPTIKYGFSITVFPFLHVRLAAARSSS